MFKDKPISFITLLSLGVLAVVGFATGVHWIYGSDEVSDVSKRKIANSTEKDYFGFSSTQSDATTSTITELSAEAQLVSEYFAIASLVQNDPVYDSDVEITYLGQVPPNDKYEFMFKKEGKRVGCNPSVIDIHRTASKGYIKCGNTEYGITMKEHQWRDDGVQIYLEKIPNPEAVTSTAQVDYSDTIVTDTESVIKKLRSDLVIPSGLDSLDDKLALRRHPQYDEWVNQTYGGKNIKLTGTVTSVNNLHNALDSDEKRNAVIGIEGINFVLSIDCHVDTEVVSEETIRNYQRSISVGDSVEVQGTVKLISAPGEMDIMYCKLVDTPSTTVDTKSYQNTKYHEFQFSYPTDWYISANTPTTSGDVREVPICLNPTDVDRGYADCDAIVIVSNADSAHALRNLFTEMNKVENSRYEDYFDNVYTASGPEVLRDEYELPWYQNTITRDTEYQIGIKANTNIKYWIITPTSDDDLFMTIARSLKF